MSDQIPDSLDLDTLRAAYRAGLKPSVLLEALLERAENDTRHCWIALTPVEQLRALASALDAQAPDSLPLYGVPFAIKDNIDLEGLPTTAACPDFAYMPERSAEVVERLIAAGALPLGKTNLDQFATGLNGTRSPYGVCLNAFDPAYVSGGSSSGSAVSVATAQVSFSLGTDTAGSGRVPAAFNNLVGLKPTRGLISTRGVVPACRSLDCVSIFALTAEDAERVYGVALGGDGDPAYARAAEPHGFDFGRAQGFRFGVPRAEQLQFFGDAAYEALFAEAVTRLEALGGTRCEIDFAPFLDAARLLYDGPWVAERYHAIREFIERQPESLLPVIRQIVGAAASLRSVDAFDAFYQLAALKRSADAIWKDVDVVLTPTAGFIPTIEATLAEPVRLNSDLGYYTNFMNLLDYAAVAMPAGFRADGLPFGVTLFAPAHQDVPLLHLAARWQRAGAVTLGATAQPMPPLAAVAPAVPSGQVQLAVCGAHMAGLPLNHQLTERGARLVCATQSAPAYRFYALAGGPPFRPGMIRVAEGGAAIEVEVWELPARLFGSFVAAIPAPLGIGKLELADGRWVPGFICEPGGVVGAADITHHGGWRAYLAQR
ncbi:allophanate hydrolase [Sinimarinibacterium sp. CAU 1509]|uniref:allophanate hydrolase n=1 Tax=Sinimarinibacterium sp. CAU 1509 TaxID=2562283 RepID=UPI0010ACE557|nr:allophanate hydrolase [Sinimarinibacterium sp. CAU 1509]TJY58381.1 allophanate hydrolase [Sinimarinibacterium sp. CAU 1509]